MNIIGRIRSAIAAAFGLCLTIAGVYILIYLFGGGLGREYIFTINDTEAIIGGMADLEKDISSFFPQPATVRIYNSYHAQLETLTIYPGGALLPAGGAGVMASLDRSDAYSRLRMYAEPDRLDLFLRKISVDKAVFSRFAGDLLSFDIQALKESAKPVFLR